MRQVDSLNWKNDTDFELGGYTLTMNYEHGGSKIKSEENKFLLMKARDFLEHYLSLDPRECRRVLELGVYQGGSFVFLDQLLKPERISALELSNVPIPALDKYVAANEDRARMYYGESQDNVKKLLEIVSHDFGGQLDLVVDDASHFYEQTKTSFKTLFPLIRPGGIYIIEDWSWSFQDVYQDPAHPWHSVASPANIMIDLMEDMARGGLIWDVQVARPLLKIRRSNVAQGEVFSTHGRRGRAFNLI